MWRQFSKDGVLSSCLAEELSKKKKKTLVATKNDERSVTMRTALALELRLWMILMAALLLRSETWRPRNTLPPAPWPSCLFRTNLETWKTNASGSCFVAEDEPEVRGGEGLRRAKGMREQTHVLL